MTRRFRTVVSLTLLLTSLVCASVSFRQEQLCNRADIHDLMKRVVAFQTGAYGGQIATNWQVGTFYTGVYAAYQATGDAQLQEVARAWCDTARWRLTGAPFHADNICMAQTYLDFYLDEKQPHQKAHIQELMDAYFDKDTLARREIGDALWQESQRPFRGRNLWWWCDALYMAPPVIARMYSITGDARYLDLLHTLYWDCTDFLFCPEEGLYYRDARYFNLKSPTGKRIFWGRGNGWVYGGLIRTLDHIPAQDPKRQKYIDLFRTMTQTLARYQQEDGLWRSSVNDPSWYAEPETSSTSFYCYGLLGGINRGYLDRQTYLPMALKAWEGLLSCVSPNGRLGHAQLVDGEPRFNRPEDFVDYTHGAFLLAASELYRMNLRSADIAALAPPYEIKELARDGAWTWYNDERVVTDTNSLYIGSVDSKGQVRVDVYGRNAQFAMYTYREFPMSSWLSKDDHNNPALLRLADGRLLVAYAQHNAESKWYWRLVNITNVREWGSLEWGPEQSIDVPAKVTYNNLFQLSEENNRIYNFSRSKGFNPNVSVSHDAAVTWEDPVELIRSGDSGTRPYLKYASNNKDRIDFLYTDGHPRNEPTNNIYHCYYRQGRFYRSDDTLIKSMKALKTDPLVPTDGTLIYDGSAPTGRAWTWDLEYDEQGQPYGAFISSVDDADGNDLRYWLAHWDTQEKTWHAEQIAYAGTHLYVPENHYAGGFSIDPDHPKIVYISADVDPATGQKNASGRYQIFRGSPPASGDTWTWQQLTFDPDRDNLRPFVPRNYGQEICVLWLQGQYQSYTDYRCRIVGILE